MKGLTIRLIIGIALVLWAWDMTSPWQTAMQMEHNRYTQIQQSKTIRFGMINHPLSYFVGSQGKAGIEYDLASAFADFLGVKLKEESFDTSEALFNALEQNKIDIAAAGLLYSPDQIEKFQIGPSYYWASWQVVYKKGAQRPYKIEDLSSNLVIANGSAVIPILQKLAKIYPNLKWTVTDKFTQEELLLQVAEGKIPYTVAVSVDISSAQQIKPNIAVGFDLTDETPAVWYLQNSTFSELQASVLEFMNQANETGLISQIEEKYFSQLSSFDYVDTQSYLKSIRTTLPKYKPLFEKYKGDLEWQMLAAIAYQESRWDPSATSPTGVRGMMMLTRDTAERMGVTNRINPEQSIKAGSEYLQYLINQLPETIPQSERIWFALTAYNMGLGHLIDLRRLTKQLGGDPNSWLDVKKYLPLLAEKRYYKNLKYGYARGFEAFSYVENIRRYYYSLINYQRITEQKEESTENTIRKEESTENTVRKEESTENTVRKEESTENTVRKEESTENTVRKEKSTENTVRKEESTENTVEKDQNISNENLRTTTKEKKSEE